jgi:hypothetical protein
LKIKANSNNAISQQKERPMSHNDLSVSHHTTFESIRQLDEQGNEFWLARQLANVLEYSQFRHFLPVVEKARQACNNSGQSIADHMEDILHIVDIGSGAKRELTANLFRATQTEEKLRRDQVRGKKSANTTHFAVGKKVRQTIQDLGGTMPEALPTPEHSIKQIEKSKEQSNTEK